MAGDGSAALGAPQIAGTIVNPRGFTKKMSVGAVGGVACPGERGTAQNMCTRSRCVDQAIRCQRDRREQSGQ